MTHWRVQNCRLISFAISSVCLAVLHLCPLSASTVTVRYREGLVHGFLALRSLDGKILADGELIQVARGKQVTCRLVFRFRDGSVHDEIAVYTQQGEFRLVSDHLIQKGPAFEKSIEVAIKDGMVVVRTTQDDKEKVVTERLPLTQDLANGLILTLLKNIRPDTAETRVSMVVAAPKPRLVKLAITPQGETPFRTGGVNRRATHFVVKIEIGGIAGVVAPILGKQPPDTHVWILGGEAPAFVKSEGPLYEGGPIWRIELVSPTWSHASDKSEPGSDDR